MTYRIKLQHFEGPFDLLLFFIERDELDIYDIPIASLTEDFLEYIRDMESMNIDLASEFILVASTLMRIKAKMLLPRKELDEEGNEIDPREELVQRLLEYKRYKEILDDLRTMEADRMKMEERGNVRSELKAIGTKAFVDAELESLTLYKLMQTFNKVLRRYEDKNQEVKHTVVRYNYTIRQQKERLLSVVLSKPKSDFVEVFSKCENRIHAIFMFLALLELVQLQQIHLQVREGINNFMISKGELI